MPIIAITEQPTANDLKAAYRPVVFKVTATRTDGNAVPPVVYCDIYVGSIYYKSIEKTQYNTLNTSNSQWNFDIADAVQEVLKTFLATNGANIITEAVGVLSLVYCKFRSSGFDTDGFITPEGTAPVQGTGTVTPVAGTGTQSNSFYVANSTLQHEQNQDLASHLNYYKSGTWDAKVYPLSHRRNGYKICNGDSDFFPVVNLSAEDFKCMVLHYKKKGDSSFSSQQYCPDAPCTPVSVPAFSFERATKGVSYSKSITISGTAPFTISNITTPTWMARNLTGSTLTFSGTPTDSDVGTGIPISFTLSNDCGSVPVSKTIDVVATSCIPVGVSISPSPLPDAQVGQLYSVTFVFTGDGPFNATYTKPSWLNTAVQNPDGSVTISGTPDTPATGQVISVHVTNCGGANYADISDTIDVLQGERHLDIANYDSISGAVTDVCTVQMTFTRTDGAMQDAQAASETIQATYTIRFDSGYVHDYVVVFNPTDTQVVMSVDGTGGSGSLYCAGVDTSTVKSVEVIP